jgi:hypothetical protein
MLFAAEWGIYLARPIGQRSIPFPCRAIGLHVYSSNRTPRPRHVPVALHRHHHSGNAEGGEAVGRGVFFLKKERNAMLNFLFAHSVHFIESLHEHGRNKSEIIGRTPTFFHRIYILTTFIL